MPRDEPPLEGDERTMLVGWLDFHRETLAMKVGCLTSEQFASRPIAGSATSLLGLVRHLTEIERTYFHRVFGGQDLPDLPFGTNPFGEESEREFALAAAAAPDETIAAWRAEVEASREVIAAAGSLDDRGESGLPLRFWLVKTLNEYARHNGHADIIGEFIDGTTGESHRASAPTALGTSSSRPIDGNRSRRISDQSRRSGRPLHLRPSPICAGRPAVTEQSPRDAVVLLGRDQVGLPSWQFG